MKTIIISAIITVVCSVSNAATWWHNGVLFGNVCRSGAYFTVYPYNAGQSVGSSCPVRDSFGNIIGYGLVTTE